MTQKNACNLLMEKGTYYVCSMITVMLKKRQTQSIHRRKHWIMEKRKDKPNIFIGCGIGLIYIITMVALYNCTLDFTSLYIGLYCCLKRK